MPAYAERDPKVILFQTDTPGPGSYVSILSLDDALKKTSDSKKGYGNFASSAGRDEKKLNPGYTPGI